MNLKDFDTNLKKHVEDREQERRDQLVSSLMSNGLNEYQIDREIEQIDELPEKLERVEPVTPKTTIHNVKFFFNQQEYEMFTRHFKVMNYVENSANKNWLLMGFLKLVEEGRIAYSDKIKDVWVV